MSRVWGPPPAPPPEPPQPAGPRATVPQRRRLRERLIDIYGLPADCTDDDITAAAHRHIAARNTPPA